MPVPKNCSMIEAAAIPEAFATAYLNLFIEGGIKEGNTLLMNAGASGLASVIIPMAKAFGIRVITTVLTDEIKDAIKHLNADRVVVTTKEDIAEVLKEELAADEPSVIIAQRPCALLKTVKYSGNCTIGENCKKCKICMKLGCPAISERDGAIVIDKTQCNGCGLCINACPFGAITKEGE